MTSARHKKTHPTHLALERHHGRPVVLSLVLRLDLLDTGSQAPAQVDGWAVRRRVSDSGDASRSESNSNEKSIGKVVLVRLQKHSFRVWIRRLSCPIQGEKNSDAGSTRR